MENDLMDLGEQNRTDSARLIRVECLGDNSKHLVAKKKKRVVAMT